MYFNPCFMNSFLFYFDVNFDNLLHKIIARNFVSDINSPKLGKILQFWRSKNESPVWTNNAIYDTDKCIKEIQ